jgi:hypothetical protein
MGGWSSGSALSFFALTSLIQARRQKQPSRNSTQSLLVFLHFQQGFICWNNAGIDKKKIPAGIHLNYCFGPKTILFFA